MQGVPCPHVPFPVSRPFVRKGSPMTAPLIHVMNEVHTSLGVPYSYLMSSSCSRTSHRAHVTPSCHASLGSSWLGVSTPPSTWRSWHFWGWRVCFLRGCPSSGNCLIFFSWLDWGLVYVRRTTAVKPPSHHIISGACISAWLLALLTWLRHAVRILHCSYSSLPRHGFLMCRDEWINLCPRENVLHRV